MPNSESDVYSFKSEVFFQKFRKTLKIRKVNDSDSIY